MDDAKWERYALLGGPIFVVLQLVGGGLPGTPPDPDAGAEEIIEFYVDKASEIGAGSYLSILGSIFVILWAASLWRAMVRAEGDRPRLAVAAVLSLGLGGALALASTAVNAALGLRAEELSPEVAVFGFASVGTLASALYLAIAAQLIAVSALTFSSGFLPKWLGGLGYAAAVASIVAGCGIASDAAVWFSLGFVAFLLWDVWILLVSHSLWRGGNGGSAPPAAAAA